MKENQSPEAISDATNEENEIIGINTHIDKNARYTWEVSLVRKGVIAKPKHKFLILHINIPIKHESGKNFKTYTSSSQFPIEELKNKETFDFICSEGYKQMIRQITAKGVKI